MAAKKPAKKAAPAAAKRGSSKGFTDEERSAMRDRVKEMKAEASGADKGNDEDAVLEKIAAMSPRDRAMAERVHAIVTASVPGLTCKLWYGMPAYAKNGTVICHFQPGEKFRTRYATLGFSDKAALDEGRMWANAFALMELTPAEEARIAALVKQAAR